MTIIGLVFVVQEKRISIFLSQGIKGEEKISASEIIRLTNNERAKEGLSLLIEEVNLSRAAQAKINDMIDRDYFAHDSPTGESASDLVSSLNYDFIIVGENLAKGDFSSDKELVDGWMNSPDHRENILHSGYKEIGVAIQEKNNSWLAVQIFATPSSICPSPDRELLKELQSLQGEIDLLNTEIIEMKREIEASFPRDNEKIRQYNNLVFSYNKSLESLRSMVANYNHQVQITNNCIDNYGF